MGMLLHRHARGGNGETKTKEPPVTEKAETTQPKKRSKKTETK